MKEPQKTGSTGGPRSVAAEMRGAGVGAGVDADADATERVPPAAEARGCGHGADVDADATECVPFAVNLMEKMIMKTMKLILATVALGAALAAHAVTTYTVSNTGEGTGTPGTLQYALAQLNGKTSGEYLIKFGPGVSNCTLKSSALVTGIGTKVVIDGTGSGVTIVKPGTHNVNAFFDISASTGSLVVSNVTVSAAFGQFVTSGVQNGKVSIVGCRFENCLLDGGGLLSQSGKGALMSVERTTFIDNAATTSGTAKGSCVNLSDGRLVLNLCSFIGNSAAGNGGVVYSSSTGNVVVANCSFVGNDSVNGNGDALYFSSPRDAWVVESLFVNQGGGTGSDIYTTTSYTNGITLAHCSCERLAIGNAPSVFNYTMRGVAVEDTSCEDVCGSVRPVFATKTVNGVRQTVLFPCATYTGLKGIYSFCHDAAYDESMGIHNWLLVAFTYMEVKYPLYGKTSSGSRDPSDILGRPREPLGEHVAPAVGAATYYEETPSLVVTTLEDVGCGGDDEISFRDAVRYAALHPELSVGGRAAITFAPSVAAQAVDGTLTIPVTEGDIVVDGALTNNTLVVAPPEGLRLDFCGKTNDTARVAAGRLFKLEENAKLELHDLDIENFQPVYGGGGALYLSGGNSVVVSNVCFRNNGVTRFEAGGAIFAGTGSKLKTYGSAFEYNEAGCCGGAVYLAESTSSTHAAHFERTTFYNNSTTSTLDDEGGAVYAGGGHVTFVNTSLIRNRGHVAALQVRPGAAVAVVNTFVTDSVAQAKDSDSSGTAINVADSNSATFRFVNSVVGGYRYSASDRQKGFCQIRTGSSSSVRFINSIVSKNNALAVMPDRDRLVTYTEDELIDCVFGTRATKIVHGVSQRFLWPREGGPLFGTGMEIHYANDWWTIQVQYGSVRGQREAEVKIDVCNVPRQPVSYKTLNTDILDNNWTSEIGGSSELKNRRLIGPVWGGSAARAKCSPNFHAQSTENGWQITVPGNYSLAYLPQICGGYFVESVKFSADVSTFDPVCAQTAQTVCNYEVEEGNTSLKAVGGALYSADGRTFVALPPDYRLGSVFIEPGVETVASNAFSTLSENVQYEMGPIEVFLPASVTTLEDDSFAGIDNVYLYFYGMSAPACTDAVFTESYNIHVFVPNGSIGWDGNPNSTALPESWHGEGVGIEHWSPTEWPSLQVTTLQDVEDETDGLISLREAVKYAGKYAAFYTNDRAEITFAPGLPVDEETGKMEIELALGEICLPTEGALGGRTLVVAVPDGQMLALVGSSAAQAHRRCLYVGETVRLELRNTEIRQFDCSGEELDSRVGGAVYLEWGSLFVASNCYFRGNGPASSIPDSPNTEGGAVFVRSFSDARFYDCSFYSNQAASGSAVAIEHGDAEETPFVLFERTSFARNRAYYPSLADNFGGAVSVGQAARVVFNTCSLVANEGFISDITVHQLADVTMVNSAVSDSIAQWGNGHETGAAIVVSGDGETMFRAVNCVFGGYQDAAARAKNYRQICGWNGELYLVDPSVVQDDAPICFSIQLVNSIVARPAVSGFSVSGLWVGYTEDEFTDYVYDVTAANTSAATYQMYRPSQTDAPKFFRPLGRDSVLYGTGVTVCHDADWENIAWRYGDGAPVDVIGEAAEATIPVTRDLLGNDWVGRLGLSARQRNIGPLGAWDLAGDFAAAARAIPDYRREVIDWSEDCRIVLATARKFLPPLCGGQFVKEVELGPAVTAFEPGCAVSASEVSSYIAGENVHYTSMGGCLYTDTPDGKVFVAAPPNRMDIAVENGTCGVGVDAFRYVRELESVRLPASLRFIESGAFAGCNFDLYLNSVSAPAYAPTSFQGCNPYYKVYVPEGSKGWNGDPNSFVLPAKWPAEDGVDGLPVESYTPEDYPSLVVTTCADVEDCYDGVISLREAVGSLSSSSLIDDRRAVITFDPALADANGVIDLSFDEEQGTMTVCPELENVSIVVAAPPGCRVRIRGCAGGEDCVGESGLFTLETIGGSVTFAGLDIEGFSSDYAAAIWSDWEATYIGELVISNCTFRNCWSESGDGGAVCVGAVKATVVDSVFEGNHQCDPDGAGGGLALRGCGWNDIAGEARVERCSFFRNYAQKGGGLAVFGCENKDRIAVVNTSIIENESSGDGAGVWVGGLGTTTFTHVSAFDNSTLHILDDDYAKVKTVAHEPGTQLVLENCLLYCAAYTDTHGTVDYDLDLSFDSDASPSVRAFYTVFGRPYIGNAEPKDRVECYSFADLDNWFNPVASVTNRFTHLPMPVRTPIAGSRVTTLDLADTNVALDQLGLARTADYNTVGAIAADPADRPLSGYEAWVAEKGLAGADAAWDAKPARWGGDWANAFIYAFGEGLVDGTAILLNITLDAEGNPVLTTAPVVEGHDDFNFQVIGAPTLDDWSTPVILNRNGNNWTLPAGQSARFFRVRILEMFD